MKFSDLKCLVEQGKLKEFQSQIDRNQLVAADYNLLLRQLIKNKCKKITPVFQKLIKKGADVNFAHIGLNKKSNLMVACEQGTIEAVEFLVAHPKIDFDLEDSMKKTAPYYAIENKNKNDGEIFLDRILKHAPHLINKPANNETMLILAIKRQKPQLVRILLNHNAEPNYVIADSGNTPLHEALKMCKNKETKANKDIVKLLIEYGGDPTIKNKKDKNVFEFADKFPLQGLIGEVQVRPKVKQEEKVEVKQVKSQMAEEKFKPERSTPEDKVQQKTASYNPRDTVAKQDSVRESKEGSQNDKWQKMSPLHKQKSKKEFTNKNKQYSANRQNRQPARNQQKENRDYRQNNPNSTNNLTTRQPHNKKLFSLNTQQQITDLIHRADSIYQQQLSHQQSTPTNNNPSYRMNDNNNDDFMSEDDSLSDDYTDSEDSQYEQIEGENAQEQTVAPSYRKKEEFTAELSEEIRRFQAKCDECFKNAQKEFQRFYHKLCEIAYNENLDVQLYGSFSTGLWYKNCDIDILLIPKDQFIAEKNPNYIETILDRFQILLKKEESIKINNYMKNKKIRVPMLRLDIEFPHTNSKNRKLDITVFDRNHNGAAIAHYIAQNLKLSPQLKPLFFVIKALTYNFKLNDPKNGGIRTYAIIIMILSFLQNERIKGTNLEEVQLGELLLRFLYFFGFDYQYGYAFGAGNDMKQESVGAKLEPGLVLTIYDPLNHSNNLGKNAKAYELQSIFKAAFIGLHSNIKQEKLEFMFGLKKICMF